MPKKEYPPLEYVRQCLRSEDGKIFWKKRPREHFGDELAYIRFCVRYEGKEAGWKTKLNRFHVEITYKGKTYGLYRHVIIWSLHNGCWPDGDLDVDHKYGDTLDDRIEGLRIADGSQSCQNRGVLKNNTSGCPGVYFHKRVKRWVAQVRRYKKTLYYRYFDTKKEAIEARTVEAKRLFGEFYREVEHKS